MVYYPNTGTSWDGSTPKNFLENEYYPTLSDESKLLMNEIGTWYIGTVSSLDSALDVYNNSRNTVFNGKIGLISYYEFLYANSIEECYDGAFTSYYNSNCTSTNWLKSSSDSWTLSPTAGNIIVFKPDGGIKSNSPGYSRVLYPVVYLKSNVKITGGLGSSVNPYTLGI